jgi:hypothetical protein
MRKELDEACKEAYQKAYEEVRQEVRQEISDDVRKEIYEEGFQKGLKRDFSVVYENLSQTERKQLAVDLFRTGSLERSIIQQLTGLTDKELKVIEKILS